MKICKVVIVTLAILIATSVTVIAGDFDWIRDFNIQAQADPTGFKARLAARFQIGDARISAVLGNVASPADAYTVLRLAEMSHRSPGQVLDVYREYKGRGWGVMAKQLGINPGSKAFKSLKGDHDLQDNSSGGKKGGNDRGKNKGKGRDKD